MSRNQRLSFLGIAAVIAVVAFVVLANGGGSGGTAGDSANTSAQQTPTAAQGGEGQEDAAPEPTATATPKPPPLLRTGKVTRLRFTEGETVRFRARSAETDEIHVHGYDRYVDLPAGKTVTASFEASITGIFEIELHGSGEPIGELRVDPR